MVELKIDRRQLLKLGISAGVLATMPLKNVVLADAVSDELLTFVSDDSLPVDAARTSARCVCWGWTRPSLKDTWRRQSGRRA